MKSDPNVDSPLHYTKGGIETFDVIVAKLSQTELEGYCLGNCLKYLCRSGYKGKRTEDFKKAQWYLNRLVETCDTTKSNIVEECNPNSINYQPGLFL